MGGHTIRIQDGEEDGRVGALTYLYRQGWTMEQIAQELETSLVWVSQVVALLGLGEERYGTHYPHTGSAPVRQVSAVASTRAGRFGKHGR